MTSAASTRAKSHETAIAILVLVVAVLAAYANSLHGPFVFDDLESITGNPTIQHLDRGIWHPPLGLTVSGRPLVNASLALNHAIGGDRPAGYHGFNVVLHAFSAAILFGVLRRTFRGPRLRERFGNEATWLGFGGALLWALHPLQTSAVTYVIQRAEALMAFCFLLTLYAFLRTAASLQEMRQGLAMLWGAAAVAASAAGMLSKEVMVTAPLVILLFDAVFIGPSVRDALRTRWKLHAAIAATWLVLVPVALQAGDRGGTAGFSQGTSAWSYALTQPGAVVHYLRLTLWPSPLVFDYGPLRAIAWQDAAFAAVLLAAVVWIAWRRPALAAAGAIFLLILAPTSSVLPIVTEPVAEHRLYLPLAALSAVLVCGIELTALRGRRAVLLGIAAALGLLTAARNQAYRSDRRLWTATVAANPGNPRAHHCLGIALLAEGDRAAAEAEFRHAIELEPTYLAPRHRLADLHAQDGRFEDATADYEAILRAHRDDFVAHNALGLIACQRGDFAAAVSRFERALRLRPDSAAAHNNLGGARYERGEFSAAAKEEETALRLDPSNANAAYNLANALARLNRPTEARHRYEQALRLDPAYVEAHANLGAVLLQLGDRATAVEHFRAALRLRPDFAFARQSLERLGANP